MRHQPLVLAHDHIEDMGCYRPAGFVLRWYALTLDITFFLPIDVLVHIPFQRLLERHAAYGNEIRSYVLHALLVVLPLMVYVIAPTALLGQTLGKRIVGLKVINRDNSHHLSFITVVLRELLGKVLTVLTFGLGLLPFAWGRARVLHDFISGTKVITYKDL